MTIVAIGSNRLEDCESLIALGDQPILQVRDEPLEVDLALPPNAPKPLRIKANTREAGDVSIAVGPSTVTIVTADLAQLVLHAVRMVSGEVVVHLDLRAFGVLVYTDPQGLHVGTATFARNVIRGARVAIALG